MSGETIITICGNLTADPELRFTPSGAAVATFTVASTPRSFDKASNEWRDGESLFMRCSVWREAAENVAESLTKGTRVVVTGRLTSRSWEDKETGQKRSAMELQVDEVGPSLRYATAKVSRTQRGQAQASSGGWQQQAPSAPAGDPWSTGRQPAADGWGAPGGDEPPF
ncbi:single-stranded DNA-binding protein [uncultured Arsenicicoccus sp.]|uniref:single-stranded DNA-binding protein n=1 Tax=uncultured Arsenicicoccus sp. TaxID=491339 RepID=UPI00259404FB|nr:single-stranded DNA-binding protein [uncultured Arsenicicoccus sp.]